MLSSGNALYDPVPVTTAQLGYYTCTVEAEQFEAMLVTVSGDNGVTISSTADYYGEIPIDDGSGMSAMDDHNWDVSTFLEESIGDDYANYVVASITGTVTYSYSTFEIAPRNASDFVFAPSPSPTGAPTPPPSVPPTTAPSPLPSYPPTPQPSAPPSPVPSYAPTPAHGHHRGHRPC